MRISKYKNIFAKVYTQHQSEDVLVVREIKNTVAWTYVISYLNREKIDGTSFGKELQNSNQEKCRIEEVIKRRGNKLCVKWKGYDDSFNSWIDKKDIEWNFLV